MAGTFCAYPDCFSFLPDAALSQENVHELTARLFDAKMTEMWVCDSLFRVAGGLLHCSGGASDDGTTAPHRCFRCRWTKGLRWQSQPGPGSFARKRTTSRSLWRCRWRPSPPMSRRSKEWSASPSCTLSCMVSRLTIQPRKCTLNSPSRIVPSALSSLSHWISAEAKCIASRYADMPPGAQLFCRAGHCCLNPTRQCYLADWAIAFCRTDSKQHAQEGSAKPGPEVFRARGYDRCSGGGTVLMGRHPVKSLWRLCRQWKMRTDKSDVEPWAGAPQLLARSH